MRSGGGRLRIGAVAWAGALFVCSVVPAQAPPSADPGLRADAPIDANRPYAQELLHSAAPDLHLAVAGSLVITSPMAALPSWDPKIVEILNGRAFPGSTTVAVADLQTTLVDASAFPGYPYPWDAAPVYSAPPSIAAELRTHGLSMVARANGHALDWGIEGMRSTGAALDEAQLKHAGTGEREGLARMASFLDEPGGKGRVALLSTATSFRPTSNALSSRGATPGRPGISTLELAARRVVPARQRAELQRLACRFQHLEDAEHCDHLASSSAAVTLFGNQYSASSAASEDYTSEYELNSSQTANELRFVREAKQDADLVILAVSAGQQQRPGAPAPTAALVRLAHAAIDAGADVIMATGRPLLGPIEVYQSAGRPPRPILYGMGTLYRSPNATPTTGTAEVDDAIIVRSNVVGDTLTLEIYPVDLRAAGGPAGVPHLADPQLGRTILERLQRLSEPFHTVIHTESYSATVRGSIVVSANSRMPTGGGP